jgi:ferritin
MNNESLDCFGEFLMKRVRDMSISHWEKIISGKLKSADGQMMHKKIVESFSDIEILEEVVKKVVDTTLHNLLWGLEEDDIVDVIVERDDHKESIKVISDGLAGELYTEDGWIARFSHK